MALYVTGCGHGKQPPAMTGCAADDSTMIYVKQGVNGECRMSRRPVTEFTRAFFQFYVDSGNKFYLRNVLLKESCGSMRMSDVMVEMPRLDSATVRRDGNYFIDKDKVVCVYENSDGGNYAEMKGVDPGSFKIFRNVFGGRDKDHVFYQETMLEGVDPQRVKVYSDMKNCSNCDGYFKDGKLVYRAENKVDAEAIPRDYKFVE